MKGIRCGSLRCLWPVSAVCSVDSVQRCRTRVGVMASRVQMSGYISDSVSLSSQPEDLRWSVDLSRSILDSIPVRTYSTARDVMLLSVIELPPGVCYVTYSQKSARGLDSIEWYSQFNVAEKRLMFANHRDLARCNILSFVVMRCIIITLGHSHTVIDSAGQSMTIALCTAGRLSAALVLSSVCTPAWTTVWVQSGARE